jgi:prolyl-tRNA editing enzyme YbaK/EbsC (Cys-tRNA(Pro) deacylase)
MGRPGPGRLALRQFPAKITPSMENSRVLLPMVQTALSDAGVAYKAMACEPEYADTAAFCVQYGFAPEQSANAIIVMGKTEPPTFACCLVLAHTKLDVNKAVCKLMGVKKASFAPMDTALALSSMEYGGVTPFGLPASIPVYIDSRVLGQKEVVIGGGNRSSKIIIDPQEFNKMPGFQIIEGLAKEAA